MVCGFVDATDSYDWRGGLGWSDTANTFWYGAKQKAWEFWVARIGRVTQILCPKQTGYCPIRHIRMGLMYGFHEGITNYAESLMRNHRSLAIMGKAIASAAVQFQVALIHGDR